MKHIYHSHTFYCNHSKFTPEELILKALNEGYETIGISEHIFSPIKENFYSTQNMEQTLKYIKEVNFLRKKYEKKIRILCGFEFEVADHFANDFLLEFYKSILSIEGVDYGIFGFHNFSSNENIYQVKLNKERMKFFLKFHQKLFESKIINPIYLAHPDAFINGNKKWNLKSKILSKKLLNLAKKHNVILAISVNGIYQNRLDPNKHFWKMASRNKNLCTLELDVHSENPFKFEYIKKAKEFAKKLNIELIDKIF